jgi:hypothetical protein
LNHFTVPCAIRDNSSNVGIAARYTPATMASAK